MVLARETSPAKVVNNSRVSFGGPKLYSVLHGTLLRKEDPESKEAKANKVGSSKSPIGSLVHTTGKMWCGAQGTTWVELDPSWGSRHGWLALNGHNFGIKADLLRAVPSDSPQGNGEPDEEPPLPLDSSKGEGEPDEEART